MDSGRGRGRGRGSGSTENSGERKQNFLGTIQNDLFTREPGAAKRGTAGRPQPCYSNMIPLEMVVDNYAIYQYHIEFQPSVDSKFMRQQMLQDSKIVAEIGAYGVFDGMILYLKEEWENQQIIEVAHPKTKLPHAVKFKFTSRYHLNDAQTINTFNVIIRRCFDDLGLKQLGRHYFEPNGSLIQKEYDQCRKSIQRTQDKIDELYGGTTIMTVYNNKLHRFTRLDYRLSPLTYFEKDGEKITLKQYFEDQYRVTIKYDNQPIIISEGKPKQPGEPPQVNYLIPELCFPTGLTDEMRKDYKMMREIARYTRLNPQQRYRTTMELLKMFHKKNSVADYLNYWNIRMADDLVQVPTRVLDGEKLIGGRDHAYSGRNAEWARGTKESGIYRGKNLSNWIIVGPENRSELITKFIVEIKRLGRDIGVQIATPQGVPLEDISPVGYLSALRAVVHANTEEVQMAVVILNDDNKTRYDGVKKLLCTELPIPSQCVNVRTLAGKAADGGENRNFSSIVLKILLQMTCKLGGALWRIRIPMLDTMLVGYDLYHDSTMKGKTVGACVSTVDTEFTEFYSQTKPHENPTQLGTNLTHFIRKALSKYYSKNNKLPTRLILYRDGAGDGQIPYIKNTEVKLVTEACGSVCQQEAKRRGGEPIAIKVAFIIVTKRINMRIMRSGATIVNPEPGTIVDSVVTRPERLDFYMVPQFVNQGTVTPVSYNILFDNTGLTPDQHHKLAFKLCHLYYNWQGTVRVPALCQYAHKMAFLVAQTLQTEAQETLRNKLYFL
ncbi:unnamed protein product [Caenorhabditis bovis]|uniref:Piwi domain-containing protein n=1 Tax=Caenorhabditis bovis TaxID=2654633 RepID=A0A8S1F803_9PELO|nr:unnamed protein product [Caenorhabditis bovis]